MTVEQKKENERIEKTFVFDLPDQYLYQTNTLQKTGTWTYKGPRYLWIFADEETGKVKSTFHYTERDNGDVVPTPEGQIKIKVDANVNPEIASLCHNEWDYGVDLPQYVESLPDGSTYGHSDPQAPDHTYEITEILYDAETATFVKPYPWKKPHITWEEIMRWRDMNLNLSDLQYKNAINPEKKAKWAEYRQILRDLPATFAGIDPWKIPFPPNPDLDTIQPGV